MFVRHEFDTTDVPDGQSLVMASTVWPLLTGVLAGDIFSGSGGFGSAVGSLLGTEVAYIDVHKGSCYDLRLAKMFAGSCGGFARKSSSHVTSPLLVRRGRAPASRGYAELVRKSVAFED